MTRAILHVDMDQFYAAVEIRDNPSLKGKPVVIGSDPQGGRGRGVVSTCSYEARAYGVKSAMPISKAYALCPQAVFLRGDMDKYVAESEKINAVFEDMTPLVEPLSLDEAFLDVSASRLLFGDGPACAKRIQDEIQARIGLSCSVGVSSNKSVSKIASDLKKPHGMVIVEAGQEAAFLAPLPVGKLWGVGPKAEEELNRLGLRLISDLVNYPIEPLRARFGDYADELVARAKGQDDRPVVPEHEAKSIGREFTFDEDERDADTLKAGLADLCEDVARRLRRHDLRAGLLTLKWRWSGFETHTKQQALDPPSSHGPDFLAQVWPAALAFLEKDRRPVRLIGISAGKLMPIDAAYQGGLFGGDDKAKERVDAAVDKLAGKYGEEAVKWASQTQARSESEKR